MRFRHTLLILALAVAPLAAQKFEVASIKPNASNDNRVAFQMAPGGRLTITGVSVKQLITQAFNVRDFQISGGPGWISSERYDINAKAEDSAGDRVPQDQMRIMMRHLLEDRFGLKVREETKEMGGYALVVAKGGPKLKESEAASGGGPGRQMMRMGRGMISSSGVNMTGLSQQLALQIGRPVVDKTGLTGLYEVELKWTPEPGQGPGAPPPSADAVASTDSGGSSIFAALAEVGLKLEPQKSSVPLIVIESVSRPSEN